MAKRKKVAKAHYVDNALFLEEMIEYIEVLNEQIAEWESETHESFMPEEETNNV